MMMLSQIIQSDAFIASSHECATNNLFECVPVVSSLSDFQKLQAGGAGSSTTHNKNKRRAAFKETITYQHRLSCEVEREAKKRQKFEQIRSHQKGRSIKSDFEKVTNLLY